MASLREDFAYFYAPDEGAVSSALRTGLVSADANVLLSLYRFQPLARDDLFGALDILGDQLWIPHQVALEFHRNRLSVIASQESYFSKTAAELDSAMKEYQSRLRAFINRIALRSGEMAEKVQRDHNAVMHSVSSAGMANEIHLDNRDSDEVLRRLETLFSNRVGEPMKPDELDTARREAKRRVDARIPPGYMDKDKADPSGDYILWKQLMKEAAKRKLPVTLITDDRKEDWLWRVHGQTIGPRHELCAEMQSEAGVSFLIMTTETFLIQAKKYLAASVSPETVNEAKELPESLASERISAQQVAYQSQLIRLQDHAIQLQIEIRHTRDEIMTLESELEELTDRMVASRLAGQSDYEQYEMRMGAAEARLASLQAFVAKSQDDHKQVMAEIRLTRRRLRDLDLEQE